LFNISTGRYRLNPGNASDLERNNQGARGGEAARHLGLFMKLWGFGSFETLLGRAAAKDFSTTQPLS